MADTPWLEVVPASAAHREGPWTVLERGSDRRAQYLVTTLDELLALQIDLCVQMYIPVPVREQMAAAGQWDGRGDAYPTKRIDLGRRPSPPA